MLHITHLHNGRVSYLQIYGADSESVVEEPVQCSAGGGECSTTHLVSNISLDSQSYATVTASNRYGSSDNSTISGFEDCTTDSGIF